ncbi:MAG: ABC transporter permease, partial [Anaerolineae bacterium]|nr:ABC transporter permease [Anaerolineae bacterium]
FTRSALSLVGNGPLITKIYFPRLIIPTSTVFAGLIDFFIALAILIIMLWSYILLGQPAPFLAQFTTPLGIAPYPLVQIPFISVNWIWLPYFTLIAIVTTLGVGYLFCAMMVPFRDIRFIIPFVIQVWLYISPVVYPSSMIENPTLQLIYSLNPMTGVVDGFRWALLGTIEMPVLSILISTGMALVLFLIGTFYFRRQERTFADII